MLSTPLPKLLVNIIRVSSPHNLDLDGKFCHAEHLRAEPCTSLLETHISIICAWSSSLASAPSSAGFCEKKNLRKGKSEKRSKFCFSKIPSFVCALSSYRAFQMQTCSIPRKQLDSAGPSCWRMQQAFPPQHHQLPSSQSGAAWLPGGAFLHAAYLVSINFFNR